MPTEIELLRRNKDIAQYEGRTTAICNLPTTHLTVQEIERVRNEPIDPETFSACMTLVFERYSREPNPQLINFYYRRLNSMMGRLEFLAAFDDLMFAKVFFADIWSYLIEHVQKQRDDGPDLFSVQMKENYAKTESES